MSIPVDNRDATATIRGYIYQFDATILSVLSLSNTGELTVEGVEDFDITDDCIRHLYQCKYYAASRLTPATLRDAIVPMLQGFVSLDRLSKKRRRHNVYGYFKDSSPVTRTVTTPELKQLLKRRERKILPAGKAKTNIVDMQSEIGLTDDDLELFSNSLTIHIGAEYQAHKNEVVSRLSKSFRVSQLEAKEYLYPSALSLISELAVQTKPALRKIDKTAFMRELQPSRALYGAWALRENGEEQFSRTVRRRYFSSRNIDSMHRFFVVETLPENTDAEILLLIQTLRTKWSSHRVKRKPNIERYAPYIYLRSFPDDRLVTIKAALQLDEVRFVDGYAYLGAQFSLEQLCIPQSYQNQLSVRFTNTLAEFNEVVEKVRGARSVFEFFINSPMSTKLSCQHVVIPATSMDMVTQIV